jgi:zinc protease
VARKYLSEASRMTIRYQAEAERKGPAPVTAPTVIPASVPYTGPVVTLAPEGQRVAPPPVGSPVDPVLPSPVEKTLKNGLRVIVAQSSRLPLVSVDLTLKVGAFADPEGRAGTASLTAGMLTEGTTTRSAQDIARQTEAMGANLSVDAGQEFASVSLNVMPGSLPKAMGLMADVGRNPAFAKEELERQRSQTLDGLSVAYQSPGQISAFALSPILYGNTPFGHVPGGTPASVEKIQVSDLSAIHQRYFRPDNAILVISGDIAPRAAFRLAEKAFGDWKAPAEPRPTTPSITASTQARQVVVDLALRLLSHWALLSLAQHNKTLRMLLFQEQLIA